MSVLSAIARPLLACPFVVEGADALARPANHRERARTMAPLARRAGIELDDETADLATRTLGATYVAAGLALAAGKLPRLAAATLAAAQVPVALANNPVWKHSGSERADDLKALAAAGGLIAGTLLAAGDRSGKPSLSWRLANERRYRRAIAEARKARRQVGRRHSGRSQSCKAGRRSCKASRPRRPIRGCCQGSKAAHG